MNLSALILNFPSNLKKPLHALTGVDGGTADREAEQQQRQQQQRQQPPRLQLHLLRERRARATRPERETGRDHLQPPTPGPVHPGPHVTRSPWRLKCAEKLQLCPHSTLPYIPKNPTTTAFCDLRHLFTCKQQIHSICKYAFILKSWRKSELVLL